MITERSLRRVSGFSSDEDDRLRTGNFEPAAAADVPACQHIVNPDQIVPRFLKPRPVLLIRATRELRLLRPLQPANVVFSPLAAMGTTVNRLLNFFFLVEKIAFVHKVLFRSRRLSFAKLAQVSKTINSRLVPVAPAKVQRVTSNETEIADFNIVRNALRLQHALSRPLVYTLRTRTGTPELGRTVATTPVVAPQDAYGEIVFLLDLARLDLRSTNFHCAALLLLRKLEPNIRAGAQSHQTQQSWTELRHRQVIVNRREENNPEHYRPRENLKTVKTVAAAI